MGIIGMRKPLKPGSIIKMPNQGQYVICEKIGEGGLSLIYSAKTKSNDYPVIVKEFFPAEHARRAEKTLRAEDGTIIEIKDRVYPDSDYVDRFNRCLSAFEQEGQLGSSARMNTFQIISFSDCGGGYAVLPRWSNDSCSFYDLVRGWHSSPPVSVDPVFTDNGRVQFALTAISSLLSAVSSIHAQNMLHLDISSTNVVWAGHRRTTPENGAAFLTDFGCSVLMSENKAYPSEYVLSYSKAYAAPEYAIKGSNLTSATDIYSVGQLLTFLCLGQRAFYKHSSLVGLLGRLHIPERCRQLLLTIIQKATAENMLDRYQSALEMQEAVTKLLRMIPANPINSDNSTAFSLYSLKSMLEGSLDTRYSWAHELCDRRNLSINLPDTIFDPVSNIPSGKYTSEIEFFGRIMPREVQRFFNRKFEISKDITIKNVLSCNYPKEWKGELCQLIRAYGSGSLVDACSGLLHNQSAFHRGREILFLILKYENRSVLKKFYNRCNLDGNLHVGLAIISLYALLGNEYFKALFGDDASQCAAFFEQKS